jgi:hypothetical protein
MAVFWSKTLYKILEITVKKKTNLAGVFLFILMLLCIPIVLVGQPFYENTQTITLIKDGQAQSILVLSDDSQKQELLAAQEICDYLEKISGVKLAIVHSGTTLEGKIPILIGRAADPNLDNITRQESDNSAAFTLKVDKNAISLKGLDKNGILYYAWYTQEDGYGTLFAAYELIEQLGVRWFMPGEIGTVIPKSKTVTIRIQTKVDYPRFIGRTLQDVQDKSNGTSQQRESYTRWSERMRLGGFDTGAHDLGPVFDIKKEPELFIKNKNGQTINDPPVVDVSNSEVLKRTIAYWREVLQKNPGLQYISPGPEDTSCFGECNWDANDIDPFSGTVSVTDRYIRFFNLVLADIQKDYPDVGISFYMYSLHMRPPVREKPNPKILPMLAPIHVCRLHSIENPLCWERQYVEEIVNGWHALGTKIVYRGYMFNLADPGLPFCAINQIRTELPYYYKNGLIASRIECKPAWSYRGPALYLSAKLMWNPNIDCESELKDFFVKFYGPAAEPMRKHFDLIEDAYAQADLHTGNIFDFPDIFTKNVRDKLNSSLRKAERLAKQDSIYAQRINMTRQGFDFGMSYLTMMESINKFDFQNAYSQLSLINEMIPKAIAYDPEILNTSYADSFTKRFWSKTVEEGLSRSTHGNEIAVKLPDEWGFMLDPANGGEKLALYKAGVSTKSFGQIKTYSQSWSRQGLRYYRGVCWYKTKFTIDTKFKNRKVYLWFSGIDETANVWVNDKELTLITQGASPLGVPWEFDANGCLNFDGENTIVVKITNDSLEELGTGGITGPSMFWVKAEKE